MDLSRFAITFPVWHQDWLTGLLFLKWHTYLFKNVHEAFFKGTLFERKLFWAHTIFEWVLYWAHVLKSWVPFQSCYPAEKHILPILASLEVLDEAEEEDITDIEIGRESLKFRKHHEKYRMVMAAPIVGNEALEERVCKIVNLVCGPSWNALEKHTGWRLKNVTYFQPHFNDGTFYWVQDLLSARLIERTLNWVHF